MGFGTCCCCLSLRTGALLLSGLMCLSGTVGIFHAGDYGIIQAIFNVGAGAVGFYAAWDRNVTWTRTFYYLLLIVFVLDVALLVIAVLAREWALRGTTAAACDDQPTLEQQMHCERALGHSCGPLVQGGPRVGWQWRRAQVSQRLR